MLKLLAHRLTQGTCPSYLLNLATRPPLPPKFHHLSSPYRPLQTKPDRNRLFSPEKISSSEIFLLSPRMMNLIGITLLLSSLAAAGLFSPPPASNHDVIREGHRLIVVEFERQLPSGASKLAQKAKDDFIDAASVLPNVGQGLSQPPIEKLCEADDACGEKTSVNNIKNKAAQLEESVAGTVKSVAETTKQKAAHLQESIADAAKSAAGTAKQKASHLQEFATDAAKAASETTREKAAHLKESAADTIKSASETTKEKADQLQESAADAVKSAAEAAVDASKDVAGNISASAAKSAAMATEAARHNLTDILRRARELGRDAAAFVGAGAAVRSAAAAAHLLGFSTAYGTCVWVTFASSHLLAFALPRQQFGIVQSRLFPAYFRFLALCIVSALAGHFLGRDSRSVVERTQGYNLVATLATVLVNLVWLEPRATKAMFERMKLDKEEGRGMDVTEVDGVEEATAAPMADAFAAREAAVKGRMLEASKRLKMLNNCSSFLNALTLMGLSWHLVHLAQCLA